MATVKTSHIVQRKTIETVPTYLQETVTQHNGYEVMTKVVDNMHIATVDLSDMRGGRLLAVGVVLPPSISPDDICVDFVMGNTIVCNPFADNMFKFNAESLEEAKHAFRVDKMQRCKLNSVRFASARAFEKGVDASWEALFSRFFSDMGATNMSLDTSALSFMGLRMRPVKEGTMQKLPVQLPILTVHYRCATVDAGVFVDGLSFDHRMIKRPPPPSPSPDVIEGEGDTDVSDTGSTTSTLSVGVINDGE